MKHFLKEQLELFKPMISLIIFVWLLALLFNPVDCIYFFINLFK